MENEISYVHKYNIPHVTLQDEYGPVTFWMLPYVFPALAAQTLEDDSIHDYDTAVRRLLDAQAIDFSQRNVLIAHQNVTNNGQEVQRGVMMLSVLAQIGYRMASFPFGFRDEKSLFFRVDKWY